MRPAFHKGGDRPCKHARQQKGQGAKCKRQHPKYKFNHSFHNAADYIPIPPPAKQPVSTSPPAKKNFQEFPFRRKPESHSRDSENFPRSGTLQWSPIGECGFAAEIPAFAGMEDGRRRQLKEFPFPRKRESPCLLIVLERDAKRQLEIRGDSRFRGNGSVFFLRKKKINSRRPLPAMLLEFQRRYFRRPVWGRARF